jgi:hypothetical protein
MSEDLDTTKRQLRDMCKRYAEDASAGDMRFSPVDGAEEFGHYEAYSVRYIIDGSGEYLGAKLMLAGGGPTVWLDTFEGEIQGFWGSDRCSFPIYDYEYIDDYWEDMYKCL